MGEHSLLRAYNNRSFGDSNTKLHVFFLLFASSKGVSLLKGGRTVAITIKLPRPGFFLSLIESWMTKKNK